MKSPKAVDPHLETPPDPAASTAIKGRGTAWQIAHRFEVRGREPVDDGWAYRGCEHGCIYCYARPTHSYLNLSPGLDFETRLVAKTNAATRLRAELARPGYVPSPINIGSATDAYQPQERHWHITRDLLEVLDETRHPATIVTKSGGIVRDLDLLARMALRRQVLVFISVTTLDVGLSRILEPRAARVMARIRDMRGGHDYDARFGDRMKGCGAWAALIRQRMEKGAARHHLMRQVPALDCSAFVPPVRPVAPPDDRSDGRQQTLF